MAFRFFRVACLATLWFAALCQSASAADATDDRFPLFAYLTGKPTATLICYTPSQLDPRNPANQRALLSSSIQADLTALRPTFDGLVLYGYHEACTPRVVEIAKQLKYRAVLLAIWDPKSADEVDGVAALANLYHKELAIGVLVGNEGVTFSRYELADIALAGERLRKLLPKTVPIGTSEPLVGYKHAEIKQFGDFLAPNIHPVFDRESFAADAAAAWAREEALKLAKETKKPVLLKETGFPHAGKPSYTPTTQQNFWKAYVAPGLIAKVDGSSTAWAFHGVAFEAYDLPWKSIESKLEIEKSWGLLSPERKAYPALDVWTELRK
ncbi:MAG TPA: hypothetical protein VL096_13040 [Pirellulaceae bacterium]|nr:hypothetical protein [Pirellulaceae bacterium]